MPLTNEQLSELNDLNRELNELAYVDPPATEEFNLWHDDPSPGVSWVCRDYVLAKAERCRALGYPAQTLTVIECYCEPEPGQRREYHAVLGLQPVGDPDTYILDSRITEIYTLANPVPPADQYRWDRRQIPGSVNFAPMS